MALINFVGFETATLNNEALVTVGAPDISSGTVYAGAYSLIVAVTTSGTEAAVIGTYGLQGQPLGFSVATLGFSFMFRYSTKPASNNEEFLSLHNILGSHQCALRISSGGVISLYTSTTLVATGTTALAVDTWYRISGTIQNGSTAPYDIKIDGVTELSGSATLSIGTFSQFSLGKRTNRNSQTISFFYDNVILDDAAEPTNVGDLQFGYAPVNGDGTTQDWTAGTGSSDYTQVDEDPPSAADYVKSTGVAGDRALFTYPSANDFLLGDNIIAVKPSFRIREDIGVNSSNTVGLYDSSETAIAELGPFTTHSTTTSSRGLVYSGAISKTDFDDWQIGTTEGNAVAMRLESAGMYVLYTLLQTITMPAIASTEVVSVPTITPQAVTLTMPTISAGSATYAPTIVLPPISISPPHISSGEVLYAPIIFQGVTLLPPLITSTEIMYAPTLVPGAVALSLPLIASTEATYAPLVSPDQDLILPVIASIDQLFAPTLTPGAVSLLVTFITSTEQAFAMTLVAGPATLTLPLIGGATLYAPSLVPEELLVMPFIDSSGQLYLFSIGFPVGIKPHGASSVLRPEGYMLKDRVSAGAERRGLGTVTSKPTPSMADRSAQREATVTNNAHTPRAGSTEKSVQGAAIDDSRDPSVVSGESKPSGKIVISQPR